MNEIEIEESREINIGYYTGKFSTAGYFCESKYFVESVGPSRAPIHGA